MKTVVVIGNGPVGMRCVAELFEKYRRCRVIVYGEEEHLPYDRIKLSSWLAGEVQWDAIVKPYRRPFGAALEERYGIRVTSIDRERGAITDATGAITQYDKLIIAAGSSAYVPPIEGLDCEGVYTLRNMDDAIQLMARRVRSRHTMVIGGGLLGLEAARGMQPTNSPVTIVEHVDRLMANQLDERSAEMLKSTVESLGFNVIVGDGIQRVEGSPRVERIVLRSGKTIDCDTVVVATGIKANISLAQDCGLSYGRGITVNDQMQTSDPDIYAIGECAEHNGEVYGLVAPGFEQAGVAASDIVGQSSEYNGSIVASRLKVVGTHVFSAGPVGYTANPLAGKSVVFEDTARGVYRKVLINQQKLIGAIGLGEWDQSLRTQSAINRHARIYPWQRWRFRFTGNLWSEGADDDVASWPESAIVCQCTGTSRGRISECSMQGAKTVQAVGLACQAGTVCGSCRPLIASAIGTSTDSQKVGGLSWLNALMLAATLVCMFFLFVPEIPYASSVQDIQLLGRPVSWHWDELWRNGLLKQITGFIVLGAIVLGSGISIRKRVAKFKDIGGFDGWRIAHLVLSVVALIALLLHSGLRLGSGLNFLLMSTFLALSLLGIMTSLAISVGHRLSPSLAMYAKKHSMTLHIYLIWPIPVLLGWHIFKGYWY